MSRAGWLLAALVAALPVHAQQVQRIDVFEYGLYAANITGTSTDAGGLKRNTVDQMRLAAATRTIPAQRGVHFGMRYRIVGMPEGAEVELRRVTLYPEPGLQPPGKPPVKRSDYAIKRSIGESSYADFSFDDPWELVPGIWTFQLWWNGRKFAEQSFTVIKEAGR